jgi:hypothetical protein
MVDMVDKVDRVDGVDRVDIGNEVRGRKLIGLKC